MAGSTARVSLATPTSMTWINWSHFFHREVFQSGNMLKAGIVDQDIDRLVHMVEQGSNGVGPN